MKVALFAVLILLTCAPEASAVQSHGDSEGYFVHQFAHVLFIMAMFYTMVVLKQPLIKKYKGWFFIRVAAFLFLLWNIDAFILHTTELLLEPREKYFREGRIHAFEIEPLVYYVSRSIENFFLLPAFLTLAYGVNRLKKELRKESGWS